MKTPLKAIEFVSRTVEAGPRFATYEMFREDGADPQTAFRAAMEITVDFRKGGKVSRAANAVMPFFNAGVQGMAKDVGALAGADVPKRKAAVTDALLTNAFRSQDAKNPQTATACGFRNGPSGAARTPDHLLPKQARYQLRYARLYGALDAI